MPEDYEDDVLPDLEDVDQEEEQHEDIEIEPKKKKKSTRLKSNIDFIKEETQSLTERLKNEDDPVVLAEQVIQHLGMNVINDVNELIVFCERWKANLIQDLSAEEEGD